MVPEKIKVIEVEVNLLEALQELLSLHSCEMEGTPPTPNQWYEAVKKGSKAIELAVKQKQYEE